MSFCIVVFYISVIAAFPAHTPGTPSPAPMVCAIAPAQGGAPAAETPEALYARRDTGDAAARAARLWAGRIATNPDDFDAAWKFARSCYWLAGHAPKGERRGWAEQGMAAGRRAIALKPDRPEGHFWLAANTGELAEAAGLLSGLTHRTAIREGFETVLRIDPAFEQGSADCALGRWYFEVPALVGGSKTASETHLRRCLAYGPQSTDGHYYLAETLFALGREAEARLELQRVLDVPFDPEWAPEDREFKEKAAALLKSRR